MSCIGGAGNLIATTTKDNSAIFVWGIYTGVDILGSDDLEGADFQLNETFDVDDNMGGGNFDPNLGTLLYENSDGTVVTVDLVTDVDPGPTAADDCGVAGTAVGGVVPRRRSTPSRNPVSRHWPGEDQERGLATDPSCVSTNPDREPI